MKWPLAWRIGVAATAVILAVAFRYFFLGGLEGNLSYITLFPAVVAAAALGGVSGGVLATILSALAVLAPRPALPTNTALGLAAFILGSAIIVGFIHLLRTALQRTAEDDLIRQNEEQLRAFVENASAAMAMFDADMRYLALSARWRSEYDLEGDIVGKSHYEVFPEIPNEWKEAHRRALQGETLRSERDAFTRADGSVHWEQWDVQPWRDPSGDIGGIIIITESVQSQAEEDLHNSEDRFKAVFDTMEEGIVTFDKTGVILAANPAAEQMFGYEASEMIGHNIRMLMTEPDRVRFDSYVAKYQDTGAKTVIGVRRKLEGLRKNGEILQHELIITAASVDRDDLFIGFIRDLTQIENEKRQTEAARAELLHVSRLSDMSEAAAGLAHEVSQPLTAIQTLAIMGRRALSSTTEPSIARLLDIIETEARTAADILRRLRGFIEKRESQRNVENLAKIIGDALALSALRSSGQFVRIAVKPSPEDFVVNADRIQIIQVLVNFLRNASDALADRPDPEVVIETAMGPPGFVRVAVSDNGPGVDPEIVDRLFTPFVTTKSYGMGVGLSLCKSIIQSHQGEIGCAANRPAGATFWFTLPIAERRD